MPMKFGRRFILALEEMHQFWPASEYWPNINYKYHKAAIYNTIARRGSHPSLSRLADLTGAEALVDGSLDDAFRRSLLADIASVDDTFLQHMVMLRTLHDRLIEQEDATALSEGRNLLAVLNRWCALNYLAVLKIVKKHDKSGRLRPLRSDVVAMLGRTAFAEALQTPTVFSELAVSMAEPGSPPRHAWTEDVSDDERSHEWRSSAKDPPSAQGSLSDNPTFDGAPSAAMPTSSSAPPNALEEVGRWFQQLFLPKPEGRGNAHKAPAIGSRTNGDGGGSSGGDGAAAAQAAATAAAAMTATTSDSCDAGDGAGAGAGKSGGSGAEEGAEGSGANGSQRRRWGGHPLHSLEVRAKTLEHLIAVPLTVPPCGAANGRALYEISAAQEQTRAILESTDAARYHPRSVLAPSAAGHGGVSSMWRSTFLGVTGAPLRALVTNFWITYAGYAALLACRKPFSHTKHMLQSELGLTSRQLGQVDAAFLAAFSLGSLLIAPTIIGSRALPRPLALALSLGGSGLCCLLAGHVRSAHVLIVIWGAHGLFSSWAYPVCVALLNPWLPAGRRSMLMGLWGTTCALGNLAASLASYYTLRHLGWCWCFLLPGGLCALLGGVAALLLHERTSQGSAHKVAAMPAAAPPARSRKDPSRSLDFSAGASHAGASLAGAMPPEGGVGPAATAAAAGLSPAVPPALERKRPPPLAPMSPPSVSHTFGSSGANGATGISPSPFRIGYLASSVASPRPPPTDGGLLATLRLPFVRSLAISYSLLKPSRSTLHFWLPYFMRTFNAYDDGAITSCLMLYDLGGLLGGVLYASALDFLNIGQVRAPTHAHPQRRGTNNRWVPPQCIRSMSHVALTPCRPPPPILAPPPILSLAAALCASLAAARAAAHVHHEQRRLWTSHVRADALWNWVDVRRARAHVKRLGRRVHRRRHRRRWAGRDTRHRGRR